MNEPSAADQARRLEREIKRLRHELASSVEALPHLRQMVQHSGDGLLLVGPGATILEANARVAHWLGRIPVQLYGQPLERWLQNPGEARVLEQRLAVRRIGIEPFRDHVYGKDHQTSRADRRQLAAA